MELSKLNSPRRRIELVTAFFMTQLRAGFLFVAYYVIQVRFSVRNSFFGELPELVALGIPFSQVTLLATWNALGFGNHTLRPFGSVVCLILIWLGEVVLADWYGNFPGPAVLVGIALFLQWCVVQVPFWIARLLSGWRIGFADEKNAVGARRNVQFGIKHLIFWTTFVAIVLCLAKLLLRKESVDSEPSDLMPFGIFLVCNSLFAWPTLIGGLINRWMPAVLLTAFASAVAVAFAEPFLFQALLGDKERFSIFMQLNAIQFGWISGSILILRRLGFRLVRSSGQYPKTSSVGLK